MRVTWDPGGLGRIVAAQEVPVSPMSLPPPALGPLPSGRWRPALTGHPLLCRPRKLRSHGRAGGRRSESQSQG